MYLELAVACQVARRIHDRKIRSSNHSAISIWEAFVLPIARSSEHVYFYK